MIDFEEFMSQNKKTDKTDEISVEKVIEAAIEEKGSKVTESITETKVIEEHKKEEITESVVTAPTGYKIFRDKAENFVCDMEISGANPTNSKARIIIESQDLTYMFEGKISQGKCSIPLKKMNFLNENETGIIRLEVIAEDTVFTPWEDNFVAVNSKKVSVKVYESEDTSSKVGIRISNIR